MGLGRNRQIRMGVEHQPQERGARARHPHDERSRLVFGCRPAVGKGASWRWESHGGAYFGSLAIRFATVHPIVTSPPTTL
jgi:hypothetical protein